MDRETELRLQQEYIDSGKMVSLPYSPRNAGESESGFENRDHGVDIVLVDDETLEWLSDHATLQLSEMECWSGDLGDEEWEIVASCGLTDRQLECFYSYHWQGITQDEIAAELGVTQQMVMLHLRGARKKLERFMRNRGIIQDTK